jgi:hypothetical protein
MCIIGALMRALDGLRPARLTRVTLRQDFVR